MKKIKMMIDKMNLKMKVMVKEPHTSSQVFYGSSDVLIHKMKFEEKKKKAEDEEEEKKMNKVDDEEHNS